MPGTIPDRGSPAAERIARFRSEVEGKIVFTTSFGIEDQAMSEQAAGYADQILNNCMLAKGFVKGS